MASDIPTPAITFFFVKLEFNYASHAVINLLDIHRDEKLYKEEADAGFHIIVTDHDGFVTDAEFGEKIYLWRPFHH